MWEWYDSSATACSYILFTTSTKSECKYVRDKKVVKPQIYGEALMKDEIMLRIEEHEEQTKMKGKKRKNAETSAPGIITSYLINLQCMCMYNVAIAIHVADIAK